MFDLASIVMTLMRSLGEALLTSFKFINELSKKRILLVPNLFYLLTI